MSSSQSKPVLPTYGRHTDLIAKLEAATGTDRGLDSAILAALFNDNRDWLGDVRDAGGERPSNFTASLDASLALVEAMLPGWHWGVMHIPKGVSPYGGWVVSSSGDASTGHAKTRTTSILIALLKGLETMQGDEA